MGIQSFQYTLAQSYSLSFEIFKQAKRCWHENEVSKYQTRFLFCGLDTSWDRGAKIGEGFHDVGPKDVGQEIFAKMEEAAQHALAIIEGAKKFTEEAEKEQSVKSKSYLPSTCLNV